MVIAELIYDLYTSGQESRGNKKNLFFEKNTKKNIRWGTLRH